MRKRFAEERWPPARRPEKKWRLAESEEIPYLGPTRYFCRREKVERESERPTAWNKRGEAWAM